MNDEMSGPSSSDSPDSTENRSPYNLLMRQSRKLGKAATRTLDVTKEFLRRDVTTVRRPESILFGRSLAAPDSGMTRSEASDITGVVQQAHEILAAAKTVILPVNLFPDSVIVDRTKVTITKRSFFWTSQVVTTRIEDILNVTSSVGPLFGSLTISTRVMNSTDHFEINYFWRRDAEYLKQIIQGYVIAQHNAIETRHLTREDLVDTLLELGRDSSM